MNHKILQQEAEICGKVPLNQTNFIQPHGVLMVLDSSSYAILQASENVASILGVDARQAVRQSLHQFVPEAQIVKLQEQSGAMQGGPLPFLMSFPEGDFLATLKQQQELLIMEVELLPGSAQSDSFIQVYQEIKYVMAAIEEAQTTEETCDIAIRQLRQLSGFDKIMVYSFDEAWNGDVIAEVKEEGMDAYLGLKFPSSDIPAQARALYQRMPYRIIPNVDYEPVKLYPVLNPATNGFTDLSESNLRSVAGVHIEYLRNMKVAASMSTRILRDNKLWGLIACHHRTPKYLGYQMCSVFELLSNVISNRISAMLNADRFHYTTGLNALHAKLVEAVYEEDSLADGLYRERALLKELLDADGVALVLHRTVQPEGSVPAAAEIDELVIWLQSAQGGGVYHQPSLPSVYEPAAAFAATASGVLAIPVHVEKGDYILAFRNEAVRKVNWGGNPSEAIQFEPDRTKYHPRASFRLWQQHVGQTALPWGAEILEAAERLRNFAIDFTLNKIYR